jgi:DNA helicase-2/ATP-dependent DNA helicase PcrA
MSEIVATYNYTEEQLKFIEYPIKGQSIILNSCAGSGKTRCATSRLQFLLKNGIDPKKIIFFSFTVAATKELERRVNNPDIKITTIHGFCVGLLAQMKKMRTIVTFYDFIKWYKKTHEPKHNASQKDKNEFHLTVEEFYDNGEYLSAEFSAFKLQTADKIKCKLPDYFLEYQKFLKETKSIDFSDMLIQVRDALKEEKWLRLFRNRFDYILVDEYQDTSSIMMSILLSLNAKQYCIIGDISQSLYGYSGANAYEIISMLKKRRETVELNLSINFRSAPEIIENSNKYSNIKAIPHHTFSGSVNKKLIIFDDLVKLLKESGDITILCRTNQTIKDIEKRLMIMRIPLQYKHYLKESEIKDIKKSQEHYGTKRKINDLLPHFGTVDNIITFIESQDTKNKISTIHKFKGLETTQTVLCNTIPKEILEYNNIKLPEEYVKYISFEDDDEESRNIHYVACSRAIKTIWFMVYTD